MAIIQRPVPPRQPSQDEDFLQVGRLLMQILVIQQPFEMTGISSLPSSLTQGAQHVPQQIWG